MRYVRYTQVPTVTPKALARLTKKARARKAAELASGAEMQPGGGLERAHRIGQQRLRVAEHLDLHPLRSGIAEIPQQFTAEPGHPHGIVGRIAAGRVGQQRVAPRVEVVEDVFAGRVTQSVPEASRQRAISA